MSFILLGTAGCHLCEQAEDLISRCRQANRNTPVAIKNIDIANETAWQEDFAVKIPVLLHQQTGKYIQWPFNQNDVLTFIQQHHD